MGFAAGFLVRARPTVSGTRFAVLVQVRVALFVPTKWAWTTVIGARITGFTVFGQTVPIPTKWALSTVSGARTAVFVLFRRTDMVATPGARATVFLTRQAGFTVFGQTVPVPTEWTFSTVLGARFTVFPKEESVAVAVATFRRAGSAVLGTGFAVLLHRAQVVSALGFPGTVWAERLGEADAQRIPDHTTAEQVEVAHHGFALYILAARCVVRFTATAFTAGADAAATLFNQFHAVVWPAQ